MAVITRKEKFENYDAFVEKFKPKKTTDDCYTPQRVYEAIKNWVVKEYGLQNYEIVRPFYPGYDYTSFDYTNDTVVIDNPPFSILTEIKKWYNDNNIKFFLFAPALTMFSRNDNIITYVITNSNITYENGAVVKTSFITNLDNCKIRTAIDLSKEIKKVQDADKKQHKPRYIYPSNVLTVNRLQKIIAKGMQEDIKINDNQAFFIRILEDQKKCKKEIFGSGFLISDKVEEKIKECEERYKIENNGDISFILNEKEQEIVNSLV